MTHDYSRLQYNDNYECPGCGHVGVYTKEIERQFQYGPEPSTTMLTANVPLRICGACNAEFLDEEADELQHAAICKHLRVMNPAEIRTLRKVTCHLSRAKFCEITRIGPATLARWERGELIQNAAYDQLLYLMQFPNNIRRLLERVGLGEQTACELTPPNLASCFPDLADQLEDKLGEAQQFKLVAA